MHKKIWVQYEQRRWNLSRIPSTSFFHQVYEKTGNGIRRLFLFYIHNFNLRLDGKQFCCWSEHRQWSGNWMWFNHAKGTVAKLAQSECYRQTLVQQYLCYKHLHYRWGLIPSMKAWQILLCCSSAVQLFSTSNIKECAKKMWNLTTHDCLIYKILVLPLLMKVPPLLLCPLLVDSSLLQDHSVPTYWYWSIVTVHNQKINKSFLLTCTRPNAGMPEPFCKTPWHVLFCTL